MTKKKTWHGTLATYSISFRTCLQLANRGRLATAQAAVLPVNGPEPVHPQLLPQQLGGQGSLKFNAGQVGSAAVIKKKKRRRDLSDLQKELARQRVCFLQWHQRELNRAKVSTTESALAKKLTLSVDWIFSSSEQEATFPQADS